MHLPTDVVGAPCSARTRRGVSDASPLGVLGGSGFYSLLENAEHVTVETPYGAPSAPITLGSLDGHAVAFLPRHGINHDFPPHRVNYRANIWALRSVGVERLIGPCAAGSLSADTHPGDFVVLDQLVDRTQGRADTFFDGPDLHHVGFASPYCPQLGRVLVDAGRAEGVRVFERGTVVVINGPRFSTRAESLWYRAQGWDVINMTQYPEAALARELGLCFAGLALITDYDAGVHDTDVAVDMNTVMAVLEQNVTRLRAVLHRAVGASAATPRGECSCADGAGPGLP